MSFLLLNEDEIRQLVTFAEAIALTEQALMMAGQNGNPQTGSLSLSLAAAAGQADINAVYLPEAPYYAVRVQSFFADNPALNLAAESGLVLVFDAATGFLAAIIIDNGYLSRISSAAIGAIAAKYLANLTLDRVAIIGVGSESYLQLKSLLAVREVAQVEVWAASPLEADTYARRLVDDHDLNLRIAPSAQAAARNADLIIVAAKGPQPLIEADWLKPGVHLTCVSQPGQQTIAAAVWQRAAVVVVDNLPRALRFGQVRYGLADKVIEASHIQGELGSLLTNQIPGRTAVDQITLADLAGLEMLDAAITATMLEKALFLGVGQRLEAGLSQWRMGQGF